MRGVWSLNRAARCPKKVEDAWPRALHQCSLQTTGNLLSYLPDTWFILPPLSPLSISRLGFQPCSEVLDLSCLLVNSALPRSACCMSVSAGPRAGGSPPQSPSFIISLPSPQWQALPKPGTALPRLGTETAVRLLLTPLPLAQSHGARSCTGHSVMQKGAAPQHPVSRCNHIRGFLGNTPITSICIGPSRGEVLGLIA